MIRTNRDRLVVVSVQGVVAPHVRRQAFRIDADGGVPFVLPGVGGITYNVRVGGEFGVRMGEADHGGARRFHSCRL